MSAVSSLARGRLEFLRRRDGHLSAPADDALRIVTLARAVASLERGNFLRNGAVRTPYGGGSKAGSLLRCASAITPFRLRPAPESVGEGANECGVIQECQ